MALTLISRNALASGSDTRTNDQPDASAFRLFIEFSQNHSLIFLATEHHFGLSIAGGSEMDEPRT
ncbi:hypothetical protein LBMAG52_43660 [Planctomycetia bacterium]|nr:hypothetical protein LBMAG52_43660 [Planctomycetia bacterium]